MRSADEDQYLTLMTSLPHPHSLFHAKRPPLSRIKLEKRLKVLTDDHKSMLQTVEEILDWRQLHNDISQAEVTQRGRRAMSRINYHTLRTLVQHRLEIRTFILALRMREMGLAAPTEKHWGFGRWQSHIVRHWQEPAFQLQSIFGWAAKAENLLKKRQPLALEQLLLDIAYKQLQRFSSQHLFDFEAVVIYVLKWNIIDRIAGHNSHAAQRRFKQLLEQSLHQSQGDLTCLTTRPA